MVAVGGAGDDRGQRIFSDGVMGAMVSAYQSGSDCPSFLIPVEAAVC
jgi:hypothetical protein